MAKIELGASAKFCASHHLNNHSEVHGHSYVLWAWTRMSLDVEELQLRLAAVALGLDHRMLNDVPHLPQPPTMENIATAALDRVPEAHRVRVELPIEGLACEVER